MLATFLVELGLATYTFFQSRKAHSDLGIVALLILLALFQLAEYQICAGSDPVLWSRIGLLTITFLPVFGIYLINKLKAKTHFVKFGFFVMLIFIAYFLFIPHSIGEAICGGNYIILNVNRGLYSFYGYYYFGFLLIGLWEAMEGIREDSKRKYTKRALYWFILGYLSFILPLSMVYVFIAGSRVAVASIMCGFAIIFAIILTFKIAPVYYRYVKR